MSRPEGTRPPELYYDDKEARKYDSSSRIISIQADISARALEMLNLPPADVRPSYILDVGCGSGLRLVKFFDEFFTQCAPIFMYLLTYLLTYLLIYIHSYIHINIYMIYDQWSSDRRGRPLLGGLRHFEEHVECRRRE